MIVSRAGTPTHRLLVPMYDREQYDVGDLLRYEGPVNWKLEPLDPKARKEWEEVADQPRVLLELRRTRRAEFGCM
jgi:hypothetical protein